MLMNQSPDLIGTLYQTLHRLLCLKRTEIPELTMIMRLTFFGGRQSRQIKMLTSANRRARAQMSYLQFLLGSCPAFQTHMIK